MFKEISQSKIFKAYNNVSASWQVSGFVTLKWGSDKSVKTWKMAKKSEKILNIWSAQGKDRGFFMYYFLLVSQLL